MQAWPYSQPLQLCLWVDKPSQVLLLEQAAVWMLKLNLSAAPSSSQLRLAIRYRGDAARLYAGKVLLTDNWYTGYQGDGEMQVGLTYLAQEVPHLLGSETNL